MAHTFNKKVARDCKTTMANTKDAMQPIELYARIKQAIGRFILGFERVITADALMMAAIMALIVWGLL